jgi:DNA-binding CsgD family transcriptional regulator/tetratricopeptide (TPR) repeat protein
MRRERFVLACTYRTDELHRGHPLRGWLAELHRAGVVERLELGPLGRDELRELLEQRTGGPVDAALVDRVHARSEGNPFFADELLAAAEEGAELPATVRDVLLARVERRAPAAQEVLRAAAVGGRRIDDGLLDTVCTVPAGDRRDALRELLAYHLLEPDGDGYAFRHALLREAVYDELLPGERAELHTAYATALTERPQLAADPAALAGALAHHWSAAHDVPRALAASVQAGDAASERWTFSEAQRHYERALALWDGVPDAEERTGVDHLTLSRRAAEAANLAGEHVRAAALTRAAIARAAPERTGLLWERLGRYLWAAGDTDDALAAYEQALALVPAEPPSPARARVLAAHGQALMLLARFDDARERCEEAMAIARAVGARAEEGHARNTLGCALAFLGEPDAAVAHLRAALEIAEAVGDLDDLGRAYQNLTDVLGGPLNRLEEAAEVALAGRAFADRSGIGRDYGVSIDTNAATILISAGRWDEAEEVLRCAEDRGPLDMAALDLHLCRAGLDVARGRAATAERHLAAARRLIANTLDPQYRSVLCAREAELALWTGRPGDAHAIVARGLEGATDPWFVAPLLWIGAWAAADAGADPEPLAARARELSAGGPSVAQVSRAYARLALAETRRAAGADPEPWAAAAREWAALGHRFPEAYARWREAEALLARRFARRGAEALAAAHAGASALGAAPLVAEIELLARRARVGLAPEAPAVAPAPAEPDRAHGLTRRELQVLGLVAAGRTNREIAGELFVTEKTAGAHVSNILGKLGVRSRVEAATAAHRLGLVDEQPVQSG